MSDKSAPGQTAIVVGGGPAGLTTAISLAVAGITTNLVRLRPATPDNRTTALLAGSIAALEALNVWPLCADKSAPLRVMRIVDDTGRLWRAPEVKFLATEIDREAFGYNIENRHLVDALEERARGLSGLRMVDAEVLSVEASADGIVANLRRGETLHGRIVIGADGRKSVCRAAAGITLDERNYPQVALTLCLSHARSHQDTSTEFHTPSGPFTLVPLPGKRSSLVWVLNPDAAEKLSARDDVELAIAVEKASHSILGKLHIEPGRGLFPLNVATARRFADKRIVLVGEAAHILPPIGAQGLNLGLRDAATIVELVIAAQRAGHDIGGADLLFRYDRMRRADVGSRALAIDLLNRSLLSDLLPLQGMRGLALYLLDRVGPLRRAVMREGVAPALSRPRLMRGKVP